MAHRNREEPPVSGEVGREEDSDETFPELDEVKQWSFTYLSFYTVSILSEILPASPAAIIPSLSGALDYAGYEAMSRSIYFATTAARIFMIRQVTLYKLKGTPPGELAAKTACLNRWCASQALDLVLELKGYYIKAAQTLTGAGQLPPDMEDAFSILLDQCPSEPFEVVQGIVEAQLGRPMSYVFRDFECKPVASASIGQVHFASLLDGTKVAVKVQYPEVEKYFRMDLQMVSFAMKLGGMAGKVTEVFETMQKQFALEFNYEGEASVMRQVAANILPLHGKRVSIPLPIDSLHPACQGLPVGSLCTRKVLTMERLDGTPIREHTIQLMEIFAKMHGTTAEELQKQMNTKDVAKIDLENSAVRSAMNMGEVGACQSGAFAMMLAARNCTIRVCRAPCRSHAEAPKPIRPLNGRSCARLLYDVHGHEIFQDGLFNSDPHAGNILMLRDGRLGLVDYGAVVRLSEGQRDSIARLFIAIADEDDEAAPAALWECGFRSRNQDPRLALLMAHVCFNRGPFPYDMNRLAPKIGMPLNPDLMTLDTFTRGGKLDDIEEFPGHLVLLQRCAMVLSGVAMELGAGRLSSAGMLKPHAVRWLARLNTVVRL